MGNSSTWISWYNSLNKPSFTPPASTISLIWTILYPIIILSFGIIFYKAYKKQIPPKVALPFGINLITNLLFTPFFFGLQSILLSTIDILIVLISLLWGIKEIQKYSKILALVQIPYLAWVTIATILQLIIFFTNSF